MDDKNDKNDGFFTHTSVKEMSVVPSRGRLWRAKMNPLRALLVFVALTLIFVTLTFLLT